MNFSTLLLLFIAVPVGELWLLFRIAELLGDYGGLITFGLVIVTGAIGAKLARGQGAKVVSAIRQDLAAGQLPTDHLISGALVLAGGMLLLTPGVVTDLLGLLLMIPGNRRLLVPVIKKRLAADIHVQWTGAPGVPRDTAEAEVCAVTDEERS